MLFHSSSRALGNTREASHGSASKWAHWDLIHPSNSASSLSSIRSLVHFVEAGNNNNPTWTPEDKHWYWMSQYQKKWTDVENVLKKSAIICSNREVERASRSAEIFMTGDIVKCGFGFYFFDRLLSKDVHENIDELFNDIEDFCKAVEQECVQSRA